MKPLVMVLLSLAGLTASAQEINIIPQPVSVKQPKMAGSFLLSPSTPLVLNGKGLENNAVFFNDYLDRFYGYRLKLVKNKKAGNGIVLSRKGQDNKIPGAYNLAVSGMGINITGADEAGVFYGIQSLIQLLPVSGDKASSQKLPVPFVSIEDYPRFAYRGLHLDVGRHFMPVDFIKKYIDYIALHKMNYFHWHLTEDQGWRIEIKKYPRLTELGAYRNGTIIGRYPGTGNDGTRTGGYYTQEQIKDIVAYAQQRYITIIPEIEMPGHGSAAIAAYPWLSCFPGEPTISYFPKQCAWHGDSTGKQVQQTWGVFRDVFCAGKDSSFRFIEDVLDEVIALFPAPYIHVGGDECPKENWKRCPLCQERIKKEGLKDEHELQSYFIQRIEKYLNSKGRKMIGWDEILEGGLAPNAIVMSRRGEEGGIDAAKQHHDVIMTPGSYCYFDHAQNKNEDSVTIGGYLPLEKVYSYEPVPAALDQTGAKYVLGAQANVWTEYMKTPLKVEYMIFPRLSALSEVLWSPGGKKDYTGFEKRLQVQVKRYDLWGAGRNLK
jgi:hexosaminidase